MACVVLSSSAYIGSSAVWDMEASVMLLSSYFMSVMFLVWFDKLIGGGSKHLYGAMF
jgi:hypothetical protein